MVIRLQKTFINLTLVTIILLLPTSPVLAESTSSSTSTPFGGVGIILTIIMIYQISKSEKIAIKETDDKHIGVAGWLLFFIGLMAIGGFIVILRIISDIIQLIIYPSLSLSFTFVFTEFLDLVSGIALIVAAYYLWKIKHGARWLAIGVLVLDMLVVGVNWLVSADELYIALSFLTIFWDTIMMIYFLTSRRVKNTYVKNAKIPKISASSNKTVIGWIIFQAVMGIIIFVVFQFTSWAETAEYSEDRPCIEYCNQYSETEGYYYGHDEESGELLCQCQTANEVIASTTFPNKPTS